MIKGITPTPGSDNPYLDSSSDILILLFTQCKICKFDKEHSCRKMNGTAETANHMLSCRANKDKAKIRKFKQSEQNVK